MTEAKDKHEVPLRNRIIRTQKPATVAEDKYASCESRQQQNWADDPKLDLALQEVRVGKSIRKAALEYGIPKSTLHNYVSGKILAKSHQGPERYLTDVEENALIKRLHFRVCRRWVSKDR